jgi:ribosomal protein S18 acetylase RimI-like enzyme
VEEDMVNQSELAEVQRAAEQPSLAKWSDLDAVTEDIAAAFADYPMSRWVLPEGGRHAAACFKLFSILVRQIGYPLGEVYRPSMGGAAAVWIPSEKLGSSSFIREMRMRLEMLAATGLSRFSRLAALNRAMERHHPKNMPHSYLFLLGVHPRLQGMGIGSRLLKAGLERVDAQARAAFLETSDETAIPLYKRFGFEITDVYDVRPGSPPSWAMWRPARGQPQRSNNAHPETVG